MWLGLTPHSSVVTTPLSDEPRLLQPPGKPALPGHGDCRDLADVPTSFQVGPQPPRPALHPTAPFSITVQGVCESSVRDHLRYPQCWTQAPGGKVSLRLLCIPRAQTQDFHTVTIAINIWPIVMYPNYLLQVSLVLSYHDFPPQHKPVSSAS